MAITIVGLGPGDGRLLTRQAWEILAAANPLYLRTSHHPAVADLPQNGERHSFDPLYDTADDFAQVYETIVAQIVQLGQAGDVVYAVPGHPFMGEATVTGIVAAANQADIPVTIISGLSFVEPTLAALAVDGLNGLQLYDALEINALHYPTFNPNAPLLIGQVYNQHIASELKLNLMGIYPDEHAVFLVHGAGTVEQSVTRMPLYEIDRTPHTAHLTSLYLPPLPLPSTLAALAETVATLRAPGGCPWDQEQTPQSMRSGLLEETSELLEALDADDPDGLREELGDLLYHIVMQVQMAAEEELFKLTDVLADIDQKLKRRHPHVWGDWQVADSAEVVRNWEQIKAGEKAAASHSPLDNIPLSLPALARSQKIQDRVSKVGFDWPDVSGVWAKLDEEIQELHAAATPTERIAEFGDILFVMVNLARWLGIDAETALRETNLRFSQRFRALEHLAQARGRDLTQLGFAALDELWQEVKRDSTHESSI